MPRVVAIGYPFGRPIGQVNDRSGQRAVLMDALNFLVSAEAPGEVRHLPYQWPEAPQDTQWHPPVISPVVKLFLGQIKKAGAKKRDAGA